MKLNNLLRVCAIMLFAFSTYTTQMAISGHDLVGNDVPANEQLLPTVTKQVQSMSYSYDNKLSTNSYIATSAQQNYDYTVHTDYDTDVVSDTQLDGSVNDVVNINENYHKYVYLQKS